MNPKTIVSQPRSKQPGQASPEAAARASARQAPKASPADLDGSVVFRLEAPGAREVLLAADFTDWDKRPIKMLQRPGGVWHAQIELAHGSHCYKFLVDGQWRNDPNCERRVPNSFGTFDNVMEVSGNGQRASQ